MIVTNLLRMSDHHLNPNDFNDIKEVTLAEYNEIQIKHINNHKWYLSEELGKEINFNEACQDWVTSKLSIEFRKYFKIITK